MEEKDIYSLVSAFKRLNYTIGFLDFACFGREHGMRFGDVEENIDDDIFLTENGYDSFSDYIIINGVKALSETEEALSSLMNYNKGIIERSLDRGFRCMEFENLIKTAREFSEMLNGGIDFTNIFRSCILNGLKVDFVGMISKMTIVANYCRQLCELYDYHTAHTPEADTTPTQAHAKQPTAHDPEANKLTAQAPEYTTATTDDILALFKDTSRSTEQPTAQATTKQAGRVARPFFDFFVRDTKQSDYNRVKALCKGRRGRELALVIKVAISEGIIKKPTFRSIKEDVGDIGSESGFNRYMGLHDAYTKEEIDGMRKLL